MNSVNSNNKDGPGTGTVSIIRELVWSGPPEWQISDVQQLNQTDIVLCVEGRRFQLHKRLLSDKSPVLRNLFTADTADKHKQEIELKGVGAQGFELLVEFFYKNQLTVTYLNVIDVIVVADYLQVVELREFCFSFLASSICCSNAVPAYRLALLHNDETLLKKTLDYIFAHVTDLQSDLNELGVDEFQSIVFHRTFKTYTLSHHEMYQATVHWLKFDLEHREINFSKLYAAINLYVFPSSMIKFFLTDSLYMDLQAKHGIEKKLNSVLKQRECIISEYCSNPATAAKTTKLNRNKNNLLSEVQNSSNSPSSPVATKRSSVGRLTFNCTVTNRKYYPLTIGNLGNWSCSEQEFHNIDWNLTATCGDSGRIRFRLTYLRQYNVTSSVGYVVVMQLLKVDGTSDAGEITFKIALNRRRVNIQTTYVDHFMHWDDILDPANGFITEQHKLKVNLYFKRFRRAVKKA